MPCLIWIFRLRCTASESRTIFLPTTAYRNGFVPDTSLYGTALYETTPVCYCRIGYRYISLVIESLFFECIADFEDVFVVVGEKLAILDDAVFFEFGFCMEFCKLGRYLSGIRQKSVLKHFDKFVESGFPVLHSQRDLSECHRFGEVEVGRYHAVECPEFDVREIVFGYDDIGFSDFTGRCIFPCSESHMVFGVVGTIHDEFCGGVSVLSVR